MYRRYNSNSRPTGHADGSSPAYDGNRTAAAGPAPREERSGNSARRAGETRRRPDQSERKQPSPVREEGFFDSLLDILPNELYNRRTKKILGLVTAEDLLLIALILLAADSDDRDGKALVFALLYILAG